MLVFILTNLLNVFAHNQENSLPILKSVQISNLEGINLDKGVSKSLYKRNNCETGSYFFLQSFF